MAGLATAGWGATTVRSLALKEGLLVVDTGPRTDRLCEEGRGGRGGPAGPRPNSDTGRALDPGAGSAGRDCGLREKNADSAKKTSNGRMRISIETRDLGHRDFAARFGNGFIQAFFDLQFFQVHDRRELRNEQKSSAVQHALLAER